MKILLTTLNAKYIHSSLALRYLAGVCPEPDISIREYTINDRVDMVAGDIYAVGAKVVGFSCYIWNMAETLELVDILSQVSPETLVLLGGPEVSYDPLEYLEKYPGVDYVISGEGEETFRELVTWLKQGPLGNKDTAMITGLKLNPQADEAGVPTEGANFKSGLNSIRGLAYRGEHGPIYTGDRQLISDLGTIPSPYAKPVGLEHKIAYVESSRGCPFNCQYCLSSTFRGVRYFPLERTKQELRALVQYGVKQIKFVDRTFNCSKEHALDLMTFLAEWNPQGVNFHFEMGADLLDSEFVSFLGSVPKGLFQFEVGVQSTNPATLRAIKRGADLLRLKENFQAVAARGNILQLLDLIAGLPGEDYQSFSRSFDEVYSWKPDKLQLGFLKLLKGSGVRERAGEYGYRFTSAPPYRVLANHVLSYGELQKLVVIEDLVDKFFNSGRFTKSLEFLIGEYGSPFACFEALGDYWEQRGYHRQAHNSKALYDLLLEFYSCAFPQADSIFVDLLKFDFLRWAKPNAKPAWFPLYEFPGFSARADSFFRQGLPEILPGLKGISRREVNKYFHLEPFAPQVAEHLGVPPHFGGDEPFCLLFYYPGPVINAASPGFIPVVI